MAFHIFLAQNVDVAILEVGIGGEHDCTNIVRYEFSVLKFANSSLTTIQNFYEMNHILSSQILNKCRQSFYLLLDTLILLNFDTFCTYV